MLDTWQQNGWALCTYGMYYHMQDSPSVSQAHVDDHNVYTASNFHNCYVVNYQTVANLFLARDDDCCGFGATGCDFTWCIARAVALLGACADFIVRNSRWAFSDALHMSMVFVRSKSFSRNKRSFNATDCVSNTSLSLNILSFSEKSHRFAICFKTDR